jgi:DNA (cytosine-5)-methyltransferase 1
MNEENGYYFLDLFSGIGGFALAARMAGIPIKKHFYSDISPYALKVYAKNFPEAEALGDISRIDYSKLPKGRWIITGGFPCQDISNAKTTGTGLSGSRSGLWWEMRKAVIELRPEILLAENVSALCGKGLDRVLLSLAEIGFDAEWKVIRASSVGCPHRRERVWIVAYPNGIGLDNACGITESETPRREMGNDGLTSVATNRHTVSFDRKRAEAERTIYGRALVDGSDNGLSERLDRNRCLGNAIVPQIAANIFENMIGAR